jgi:putative restriction endonuclease
MKFWVSVTDNRWFDFLQGQGFDEVNFWQPSAKPLFANIAPGTPFFFKLKRPRNHIGGFGTFVSFVKLPLLLAWETFGEKNGAASFAEFAAMIRSLSPDSHDANPEIGCTLLALPEFFRTEDFLRVPGDWASNIVRGKSYDDSTVEGARLVEEARAIRRAGVSPGQGGWRVSEREAEYSAPYLAKARLGQGTFRALVTDAYERRCAITGENILPVLEAAHIKPFAEQGPSKLSNGLLLRSDFHKLFDLGYITVTPDLRIEVSSRIREEWFNGKAYYRLHGEKLASSPRQPWCVPGGEYLRWHNENAFRP